MVCITFWHDKKVRLQSGFFDCGWTCRNLFYFHKVCYHRCNRVFLNADFPAPPQAGQHSSLRQQSPSGDSQSRRFSQSNSMATPPFFFAEIKLARK